MTLSESTEMSTEVSDNHLTSMEKAGVQPFAVEKAEEKASDHERHRLFLEELGSRWFTVEPLVIVYMAASMALLPILQQYTHYRLAEEYNITNTEDSNQTARQQCLARAESVHEQSDNEKEFTASLSVWNTAMIFMGIAPTLLSLFIVGAFSDKRGRRYAFIPQTLAGIVGGCTVTIVVAFKLDISLLVLSNIVVGITGSMPAVAMASYAYIADINPPEKRFMRIVIIEIGTGLGTLVGNLLFGWLIKDYGFIIPSMIFTLIMIACFVYCTCFIPETIYVEPGAKLCDMSALRDIPKLWFKRKGSDGRLKVIWLCLGILLWNTMLGEGPTLMFTFIFVDQPLCWDSLLLGMFNGIHYVVKAFGSLVFMKLMFGRAPPEAMQLLGLLSAMTMMILLGVAKTTWVAFVGGIAGCGSMLVGPISRSIASSWVPDNFQGSLFSGLGWAQMFSMLICSPVMNLVYERLGAGNGSKLFLMCTPFFLIPIALVIVLYVVNKKPRGRSDTVNGVTVADTDILAEK